MFLVYFPLEKRKRKEIFIYDGMDLGETNVEFYSLYCLFVILFRLSCSIWSTNIYLSICMKSVMCVGRCCY